MLFRSINGNKLKHLKIFEAKEKFVDELKNSPINYSIVRPNGFFTDMKDFLQMAKSGRVYLFGSGTLKMNPIHGEDLAKVCAEMMEEKILEQTVGGMDIFSHNQLAELALKAWGKRVRINHLPDWTRRFIIWILRTFTSPKTHGPVEFFLTAMASNNIAKQCGSRRLEDFFEDEVRKLKDEAA